MRISRSPILRKTRLARSTKPIRRSKAPRKQRKTSLAAEKRGLWREFAAFVKQRDGNACFTCGATGLEGQNWHAGHMIGGRRGWVLFDPELVRSQCYRCNVNLKGNAAEFALRYIDQFGEAKFRAHVVRARTTKQWTVPEIQALRAALKCGWAEYELLYAERYVLGR